MDENKLASEVNNVTACEAVGCCAKAVEEIRVKVGQLGFIRLTLCSNCKSKFVDYETTRITHNEVGA